MHLAKYFLKSIAASTVKNKMLPKNNSLSHNYACVIILTSDENTRLNFLYLKKIVIHF